MENIRVLIKTNATAPTNVLIRQLNARIRGWANYYRHVVSKNTFDRVDHRIFESIFKWTIRRHPNKTKEWLMNKYFRSQGIRNWIFSTKIKTNSVTTHLDLFRASSIPIKRHIKIKATANPFDANERDYFERRGNRIKISPRDAGVAMRELPSF